MKILWASNYTSYSGYAQQARLFVPAIQRLGHDVTVLELGTSSAGISTIGGVKVLPTIGDRLGHEVLDTYMANMGFDVIISLIDAWGLNPTIWGKYNWFPYTPVDTLPIAPAVLESIRHSTLPIAMSAYGHHHITARGLDAEYMPLAYDDAVFMPRNREEARAKLGWPQDQFVALFVGVNNAHPSRKGIFELLAGWQLFAVQHPDAMLYLHTAAGRPPLDGVDIPNMARLLGIESSIKLTDPTQFITGVKQEALAGMYAAADVLILPSRGEGFGLPLIEAQACGTPVITTDCAAGTELCASGWLLEGEPEYSNQNALVVKAGVRSIAGALEKALHARGDERYRKQACEFARDYAISRVAPMHLPRIMTRIADAALGGVS